MDDFVADSDSSDEEFVPSPLTKARASSRTVTRSDAATKSGAATHVQPGAPVVRQTSNRTQSDAFPTLQARLAATPPISNEPLKVSPNGQHIRRPTSHPLYGAKMKHYLLRVKNTGK